MKKFDLRKVFFQSGYSITDIADELDVKRPTVYNNMKEFEEKLSCKNKELMMLFCRFTYYDRFTKGLVQDQIDMVKNVMRRIEYIYDENSRVKGNELYREFVRVIDDANQEESEKDDVIHESSIENNESVVWGNLVCNKCDANGTLIYDERKDHIFCQYCMNESQPEEYGITPGGKYFIKDKKYEDKVLSNDNDIQGNQNEYVINRSNYVQMGDFIEGEIIGSTKHGVLVLFNDNHKGFMKISDLPEWLKSKIDLVGWKIIAEIVRKDGKNHNLKYVANRTWK
ncbi:hypothetical protein [Candidatus Xianfuyuplasma coldseepsis]|uniref:S1 motif domain-containing protein n=1 Tax=Candidatus Xianfuyuplasma coldseepsis TaxID=2782163 RepID=A0A7L7KR25_9MOLU|nr:hypothetical protein [Xianfuyuplasma coldseepsis]QMS85271.1 hypothetical protein G4Z02_05745 [Xianfuyuplasma coldseepsis]